MKTRTQQQNNSRKYTNSCRLNKTLLNDQWVIVEIREEIKRLVEDNENENTSYLNLWNTAKAVLRGKLIAMNAYINKTERSQINDLMLYLKPRKI
jgi:hypothetical protein